MTPSPWMFCLWEPISVPFVAGIMSPGASLANGSLDPHHCVPDGVCVACSVRVASLVASLDRNQGRWDAGMTTRSRLGPGANAVSCVEYSNRRGLLRLDVGSHGCRFGGTAPFPLIRFVVQARVPRFDDRPGSGVHFRVTYHLGVPGELPFHWEARSFVRMVFPIFGRLREFWGRAVEIFGEVTFTRRTDGSRSGVHVSHNLQLRAAIVTPGVLRYTPIDGAATFVTGARPDISIMGAALQWLSVVPPSSSSDTDFPEPLPTTNAELERSLLRPDVPSSLLRYDNGTWVLTAPSGSTEADSASSHGFLEP